MEIKCRICLYWRDLGGTNGYSRYLLLPGRSNDHKVSRSLGKKDGAKVSQLASMRMSLQVYPYKYPSSFRMDKTLTMATAMDEMTPWTDDPAVSTPGE